MLQRQVRHFTRRLPERALSSVAVALKRLHSLRERFWTTSSSSPPSVTARRKVSCGASPATYSREDREGFYGRFSTTTPKEDRATRRAANAAYSRVREVGGTRGGPWRSPLQVLLLFVVAFDLVFGFARPFVAEPMRVPSRSMAPTLQPHDHVLTNKLAYDFSPPERGDLAVFESVDPRKDERLVKRVVGLPGDEVRVEHGVLLVNGAPPYEPYKKDRPGDPPKKRERPAGANSFGPIVVPEDSVFVMGDNRNDSYDSRFFGPVPNANLVGEVTLRFWPPGRLGTP